MLCEYRCNKYIARKVTMITKYLHRSIHKTFFVSFFLLYFHTKISTESNYVQPTINTMNFQKRIVYFLLGHNGCGYTFVCNGSQRPCGHPQISFIWTEWDVFPSHVSAMLLCSWWCLLLRGFRRSFSTSLRSFFLCA